MKISNEEVIKSLMQTVPTFGLFTNRTEMQIRHPKSHRGDINETVERINKDIFSFEPSKIKIQTSIDTQLRDPSNSTFKEERSPKLKQEDDSVVIMLQYDVNAAKSVVENSRTTETHESAKRVTKLS
jgi:hypothetical protein